MMPKFRAYDEETETMFDVLGFDLDDNEIWSYDQSYELNKCTIMQSTGFKDKNGMEIYEGDILYFEPYETHSNDRVVEYIDGAYYGRLIRNGYSKLLAEFVYETKVIGNIYKNPELLEVSE